MKTLVVDASVGIKWFLPEAESDMARSLLDGKYRLWVPDLFFTEIANVLWHHCRTERLTKEQAEDILKTLKTSPMRIRTSVNLLPAAFEIATQTGLTIYDSLYVTLAEQLKASLVTSDAKLINKLRSTVLKKYVIHLHILPTNEKLV